MSLPIGRLLTEMVQVRDLQLGDVVQLQSVEPYGSCTVYQCHESGDRSVWRPYVMTGDVEYAGHTVIPSIGLEDFTLSAATNVVRVRKGAPKR